MITQTQINLMVLEEGKKWNEAFVYDAIKEWDKGYSGCFAEFVQIYVASRWAEMAQAN